MDTKEEILARMKGLKVHKTSFKLSKNISKILLSVILLFSVLIICKASENSYLWVKENVFTNSMSFTKINAVYEKYFGSITPVVNNDEMVLSASDYLSITDYDSYEKVLINGNYVTTLCGGIVVYTGEKDETGYTVIVQGNDGYNIWYGNLESSDLTLYDYVETSEIIGQVIDNELYLIIKNDSEIVKYEDY